MEARRWREDAENVIILLVLVAYLSYLLFTGVRLDTSEVSPVVVFLYEAFMILCVVLDATAVYQLFGLACSDPEERARAEFARLKASYEDLVRLQEAKEEEMRAIKDDIKV